MIKMIFSKKILAITSLLAANVSLFSIPLLPSLPKVSLPNPVGSGIFNPTSSLYTPFKNLIQDLIMSNIVDATVQLKNSIDNVFFVSPSLFTDRPAIYDAWRVCRNAAFALIGVIIMMWAIRYMLKFVFVDTPRATQFIPRVLVACFLIWVSDWIVLTAYDILRYVYLIIFSYFQDISVWSIFTRLYNPSSGLLNFIVYGAAIIIGIILVFQCLVRLIGAIFVFVTSPFAFLAWANPSSKPIFDGWLKFASGVLFSWILNLIVIIIISAVNSVETSLFGVNDFLNSLLSLTGLYFLTKTNKYCQEMVGSWGTYTNVRQGAMNMLYLAKGRPSKLMS